MSGLRAYTPRSGGRLLALASAATLIAGGTIVSLASSASAENTNSFALTAEGDGNYIEYNDNQLPATQQVAVSPFSAQSLLDSSGNSSAFAGLPYLGAIATTLPGTVNGLSGGATPPIPPAPGYVSSSYPSTEHSEQVQGPYTLKVATLQYESSAIASLGLTGTSKQTGYSTAHTVANDDGSVQSTATAGVTGFAIGPITALDVSTSIDMKQKADAAPVITYSQNLGTFTVAGFQVGITEKGFSVLGANLPLPVNTILDTVNAALSAGGVKIEVTPSVKTFDDNTKTTQFTSSAVKVSFVEHIPTQGDVNGTSVFGRATVGTSDIGDGSGGSTSGDTTGGTSGSSATTGSTSGDVTSAGTTGDVTSTGGTTGTTGTVVGTGGTTGGDVTSSSGDISGSGGAVVDTSTSGGAVVGAGTGGDVTGSTGGDTAPVTSTNSGPTVLGNAGFVGSGPTGTDSWAIYLVLVLAAAAILIGQRLFAYFGVKLLLKN